ncbi:MAG: amine oxidase, partial [Cyanobacteria bacterium J06555_13]
QKDLSGCIPAFGDAKITDHAVVRIRQGVSHFAPGSYRYLLPGTTSFANLFMSGDWIVTRHGSWSQEKAYVTGLEAANNVIDKLGIGYRADVIPIVPDEPHIQAARAVNQAIRHIGEQLLPQFWLP